MDRATGAYIDEKTGREMQTLASGRHIDLDAELDRLGVQHDAGNVDSPERWGLRAHWANVGFHKDDDLTKAHIAQHCQRHHANQAAEGERRARDAAERATAAEHLAQHEEPHE